MWYIVPQFVGFLIFLVAGFAETNRAPFDLTEADAELVGGYNTEYGGGRFASYYFAEYLNVLVVSGIVTTVFLGGWLLPFGIHPPGWVDPFVVLAKMALITFLFIWIRATLPRLRYDQLMSFGWKVLLPLATLNALVTAIVVVADALMAHRRSTPGWHDLESRRGRDRGQRAPAAGRRGGAYRAFGETLRGLKTTFARIVEGPDDDRSTRRRRCPSTRASAGATSCTASRTRASRSASAARCARPPARPTASASWPPRTPPRTASRPASATRRCMRSTSRAASSAATARSPARSTRSRWATTTSCPTTTARDLIFTKEMLLAEPLERTPLRNEGE